MLSGSSALMRHSMAWPRMTMSSCFQGRGSPAAMRIWALTMSIPVTALEVPGGPRTRWDGMLFPGYKVMPFYDSLVGKLIVWGEDRADAIAKMQRALSEFKVEGIKTTVPVHQRILASNDFREGRCSIEWLEGFLGMK